MSSVLQLILCCTCITLLLGVRVAHCTRRQAGFASAMQARSANPAVMRVTAILADPFLRRAADSGAGGEEFEGFIPDLLKNLSRWTSYDYRISLVSDGKYGAYQADGSWNGMIGQLTRGEADVAAGPLTVMSERERVVDFTKPFMSDQIVVLMKKRHAMQWNIQSVEDLSRQSYVKYGVLDSGTTESFFQYQASQHEALYARMWQAMAADDSSRVATLEEGLDRVMSSTDQDPWAFIGSGVLLDYAARGRCDLQVFSIGGHRWALALATPIGSAFRDNLTLAVLELLEAGEIARLRTKWFYAPFVANPIVCDH